MNSKGKEIEKRKQFLKEYFSEKKCPKISKNSDGRRTPQYLNLTVPTNPCSILVMSGLGTAEASQWDMTYQTGPRMNGGIQDCDWLPGVVEGGNGRMRMEIGQAGLELESTLQ